MATPTESPETPPDIFSKMDIMVNRFERFGHTQAIWVVTGLYAATLLANIVAYLQFGIPDRNPFMLASLRDPVYITIILMVIVASIYMNKFFQDSPRTYQRLFDQRVIIEKQTGRSAPDLVALYNGWNQSKWRVAVGAITLLFGAAIVYNFIFSGDLSRLSPAYEKQFLGVDAEYYFVIWLTNLINAAGFLLMSYGAGILIYKMIVSARLVYHIPEYFDLNLQPEHPDGVGGFKPIGELCLDMVYSLLPGILLASFWLLVGEAQFSFVGPEVLPPYARTELFPIMAAVLIVGLVVAAITVFIWPMWTTHVYMAERTELNKKLDEVVLEIDRLNQKLTNTTQLDANERKKLLAEIDSLRSLYQRQVNIPTWPFERSIALRFVSVQLIPFLSFLFQGNTLFELIGVFLN